MKYTKRTSIVELQKNYEVLVGWGTAVMEFEARYNPTMYHLDYLINGKGVGVGTQVCGNVISAPSVLEEVKGKKVCVILYSNKETEIMEQIEQVLSEVDIIVGRLVAVDELECTYSRDREDKIMSDLIKKLKLDNFTYMDVGVCHPVVRNNTYLFYAEMNARGVLVEPNPIMAQLANDYRPLDKMLVYGATGGEDAVLSYYEGSSPGLNTFSKQVAEERGILNNVKEIPVRNINTIIAENFDTYPDILDIDTEGMDLELLKALDTNKYKVKIICAEVAIRSEAKALLEEKGYTHYCTTIENRIFVRNEELSKIRM
ncbi:MAG: FkbM family methyltransferase [Clostridium sp.]|nr:FkbM family methyltransferase [Clostridium sp.]